MTTYAAAAWSHSAECSYCGSPLEIPRHDSPEARVRAAAYPTPRAIARAARQRRRRRRTPDAVELLWLQR